MVGAAGALVLAALFDYWGVGSRKWANIVAAVLALAGFTYFLAPSRAGQETRRLVHEGFAQAADLVSQWDPRWGSVVGSAGLSLAMVVVGVLWIAHVAPKNTPQGGEAFKKDLTSAWIWGGAAVMAIFSTAIPGNLGEVIRWLTGFLVRIANWVVGAVL